MVHGWYEIEVYNLGLGTLWNCPLLTWKHVSKVLARVQWENLANKYGFWNLSGHFILWELGKTFVRLFQSRKDGKSLANPHSIVAKTTLIYDVLWAAKLNNVYSLYAPPSTVRKLFDETPQRNERRGLHSGPGFSAALDWGWFQVPKLGHRYLRYTLRWPGEMAKKLGSLLKFVNLSYRLLPLDNWTCEELNSMCVSLSWKMKILLQASTRWCQLVCLWSLENEDSFEVCKSFILATKLTS